MCPPGSGSVSEPGTELKDTTCRCDLGYCDRSGLIVAGDNVQQGQALSQEACADHLIRALPTLIQGTEPRVAVHFGIIF